MMMRQQVFIAVVLGLLLVGVLLLLTYPVVVQVAGRSASTGIYPAPLQQHASRPELIRQLGELTQKSHELRRSEARDIAEAARMVERWYGIATPSRAMAPDPNARQPFDPDTASLYDIVRTQQADGSYVYEFIYVDAAGQTLCEVRAYDQMNDQDLAVAQVFEMARQNPNLRILIETVRRMAESAAATSEDRSPPPRSSPPPQK